MPTWQKSLLLTFQFAGHLAYMVLLPLFIFGGLGLLIDRQLATVPTFLFVGIGIAFITTIYWMKTRLHEIIKQRINQENEQ